jgi:hypothetical protein
MEVIIDPLKWSREATRKHARRMQTRLPAPSMAAYPRSLPFATVGTWTAFHPSTSACHLYAKRLSLGIPTIVVSRGADCRNGFAGHADHKQAGCASTPRDPATNQLRSNTLWKEKSRPKAALSLTRFARPDQAVTDFAASTYSGIWSKFM